MSSKSELPRRKVRFALAGALAGCGAPLGWLLWRLLSAQVAVLDELWAHPLLYGYMLVGTVLVCSALGTVLGTLADRLTALNRVLSEQAITDALTGLRNARYFHDRLREECARADRDRRPLALLMLDLDHFKEVNDRRGHAVGDRVLAHTAQVISGSARIGDVSCRVGGEEFAVLCPGAGDDEALHIAERIRAAIEARPFETPGERETVTLSVGVAIHSPGDDAGPLFDIADSALYEAKRAGRNCVRLGARRPRA